MGLAFEIIFRLMHMFAAITAVGGIFFMRLALLPAVSELPDEARQKLHTALRKRWSKVVMACILFLLVSGITNFVLTVKNKEIELAPYYHALFGIKFLLAMAIFFISSLLSGRSAAADRFRQNVRFYLTANMLLAIALVTISGVLRSSKTPKPAEDPPQSVSLHRTAPLAWKKA